MGYWYICQDELGYTALTNQPQTLVALHSAIDYSQGGSAHRYYFSYLLLQLLRQWEENLAKDTLVLQPSLT